MNQDAGKRDGLQQETLEHYARLNDFLTRHNPSDTFHFERFGLAEMVFTPFFMRFWFSPYNQDFESPCEEGYARLHRWSSSSDGVV